MPFCAEGAKRHYKGLTIDGIFGVVYSRLELHVGAEIALCRARVYVCVCVLYVRYQYRATRMSAVNLRRYGDTP